MPKRIPIKAIKKFAIENDCTQVIVAAWDGKLTHVATYGKTIEDCAMAAFGGNKIKEALGWPKDLNAEPSRVQALLRRIDELEAKVNSLTSTNIWSTIETSYAIKQIQQDKDQGYLVFLTEDDADTYINKEKLNDVNLKYNVKYEKIGFQQTSYFMYDEILKSLAGFVFVDELKKLRYKPS